jgi:hypothetical protein
MTESHLTSPFLPVVGEDGRSPGIAHLWYVYPRPGGIDVREWWIPTRQGVLPVEDPIGSHLAMSLPALRSLTLMASITGVVTHGLSGAKEWV